DSNSTLVQAAVELQINAIVESEPSADQQEALSLLVKVLKKDEKNILKNLTSLFLLEKNQDCLKKIEDYFIKLQDSEVVEALKTALKEKSISPSICKILASRSDVAI